MALGTSTEDAAVDKTVLEASSDDNVIVSRPEALSDDETGTSELVGGAALLTVASNILEASDESDCSIDVDPSKEPAVAETTSEDVAEAACEEVAS